MTAPPGNSRRNATVADAEIPLACDNPTGRDSSDETGMHGKEKIYGLIP